MLLNLLHGDETKVWGDAGYQSQTEAIRQASPGAQDMTSRRVKTKAGVDEDEKRRNRTKALLRVYGASANTLDGFRPALP